MIPLEVTLTVVAHCVVFGLVVALLYRTGYITEEADWRIAFQLPAGWILTAWILVLCWPMTGSALQIWSDWGKSSFEGSDWVVQGFILAIVNFLGAVVGGCGIIILVVILVLMGMLFRK